MSILTEHYNETLKGALTIADIIRHCKFIGLYIEDAGAVVKTATNHTIYPFMKTLLIYQTTYNIFYAYNTIPLNGEGQPDENYMNIVAIQNPITDVYYNSKDFLIRKFFTEEFGQTRQLTEKIIHSLNNYISTIKDEIYYKHFGHKATYHKYIFSKDLVVLEELMTLQNFYIDLLEKQTPLVCVEQFMNLILEHSIQFNQKIQMFWRQIDIKDQKLISQLNRLSESLTATQNTFIDNLRRLIKTLLEKQTEPIPLIHVENVIKSLLDDTVYSNEIKSDHILKLSYYISLDELSLSSEVARIASYKPNLENLIPESLQKYQPMKLNWGSLTEHSSINQKPVRNTIK